MRASASLRRNARSIARYKPVRERAPCRRMGRSPLAVVVQFWGLFLLPLHGGVLFAAGHSNVRRSLRAAARALGEGPRNQTKRARLVVPPRLLARKRGLDARTYVRDQYGHAHSCTIVSYTDNPSRCRECQSSCPNTGVSVNCPLWATLKTSASIPAP